MKTLLDLSEVEERRSPPYLRTEKGSGEGDIPNSCRKLGDPGDS